MGLRDSGRPFAVAVCGAALLGSVSGVAHQPAPATPPAQTSGAPATRAQGAAPRSGAPGALFRAMDVNKDDAVSRQELETSFDAWFSSLSAGSGLVTQEQLATGLTDAFQPGCGGRSAVPAMPCAADVQAMLAALPTTAPAKPAHPRRILVLAAAEGFVHSSIPLAAMTVEALGEKTKAWSTAVTYNPADINEENLKQYDAVFLDSTTGCFLDDPNDKGATTTRRQALMNFVRSGKGIGAIHASTDSYHGAACAVDAPVGGRAAGAGANTQGDGPTLARLILSQGDKNADQKISRQELTTLVDLWFDKLDAGSGGRVKKADFEERFNAFIPSSPRPGGRSGPPGGNPLWPEFNRMMGGYFKFHWNDPQEITYKIDDPDSPLTAMFKGAPLVVRDETYVFNQESFSREHVRVLTSVDYSKMSEADKAKEPNPRTDQDYALSYIRREGTGRVFYMAHGHHERNYAVTPLLAHLLAGVQYALGDLKADDTPRPGGGAR